MLDTAFQPVVALCDESEPSPVRVAAAVRGWSTLPTGPWRATLRSLMRRPEVALAVMSIEGSADDGVRLLEALRHGWRRVHVLAVARQHSLSLEARARAAGVDAYLAAEDPDTICHAASDLLARLPVSVPPATCVLRENRSGAPPGTRTASARSHRGPPPDG